MELRLIGIDPGITRTGIVLGKIERRKLVVLKHSVFGAEGANWYEKCDDISSRVKSWILNNTDKHTRLIVFVEEPINFQQKRAWSAAIQNRAFSSIISELSSISMESRPTQINTVQPMTMKKLFARNGHAPKDWIIRKAKKLYPFKSHWSRLNTETIADAIGIMYCAYLCEHGPVDRKGILGLK